MPSSFVGDLESSVTLRAMLRRHHLEPTLVAIVELARQTKTHDLFGAHIMRFEPEMRVPFYDAMRPHLSFKAKPLDVYDATARERAEREQLPVMVNGKMEAFRPAQDVASVRINILDKLQKNTLTLKCAKCQRQQSFSREGNETPTSVVRRARLTGWVYDFKLKKPREICPECAVA